MKNNFDRTKTATARFSTRAIAMMLFFVMLLTAIGSGSVLSAIAADFDTVSGDAIPAAATEGTDIALNAIPDESTDEIKLTRKGDVDLSATGYNTADFYLQDANGAEVLKQTGITLSGNDGTATFDISPYQGQFLRFYIKGDGNDQYGIGNSTTSQNYISNGSNFNLGKGVNPGYYKVGNSATSVTFTFKITGNSSGNTIQVAETASTTTWTVAGSNKNLFGTAWAADETDNDMLLKTGTTYEWTKNNVSLTKGTIQYKVVQNHSWDNTSYPGNSQNSSQTVAATGVYNVKVTFDSSTGAMSMTLTAAAKNTLTVDSVDNAVVKATYNGKTANEDGTLEDVLQGETVTVTVTPDPGYKCTALTSSGGGTVAGSSRSWTVVMPDAPTTITATIAQIQTRRVYFSNNNTGYSMLNAYVKSTADGEEPLGVYPGTIMTRLDNSNIWYIEVPDAADYQVEFIGDNGYKTGLMTVPWADTNNTPKYIPPVGHPEAPTEANRGTWAEYTDRDNEYTVTDGSTMSNSNLFTGISATLYDYYVDGEIADGWLTGIKKDEYNMGKDWEFDPYTTLNEALSDYVKANGTSYGLYFGNLNKPGDLDGTADALVKNYKNFKQDANNSEKLGQNMNAATGLTGKSLSGSTIHYYKSGATDENGASMAMFNEDFLSGENSQGKDLATILRTSTFPVRKTSTGNKPTQLYLNTASFTNWENDGAIIKALFYNNSVDDSNRQLATAVEVSDHFYKVTIPAGYTKVRWVRMNPGNEYSDTWNSAGDGNIPTTNQCVCVLSGWDAGSWESDSLNAAVGDHPYYEYDSTNGTDNAFITDIDTGNKTAQINYYDSSQNIKVKSDNNNFGFFPFDYNNIVNEKGTIYLDVSYINNDVAQSYWAHFFTGNDVKDVKMESAGAKRYKVGVPGNYKNVIFTRNEDANAPNDTWSNVWNQTATLIVPDTGAADRTYQISGFGDGKLMNGDWTTALTVSGNGYADATNHYAHDQGFGAKLVIPFTLETNGKFSDNVHQVFNFSGDDDLWVYVDNKLVLDLGGAHAATTGSIDFADKLVTANSSESISGASRNTKIDWFDNTKPNTVHTMTIYYMERGMHDSNLKFGFSFHAIPNQFKTEKKVRTRDINSGFYIVNDTTKSATQLDGRDVTKFEQTYQTEEFDITHKYSDDTIDGTTPKGDISYSIGENNFTATPSNKTIGYTVKNDDIAYFLGQFRSGETLTLSEAFDGDNKYKYTPSIEVYDDANNSKKINPSGDNDTGYSFTFAPTTTVSGIENLNVRARFINQMVSHDLTLTKAVSNPDDKASQFTLKILFKFGTDDYIAYPVYCTLDGENVQLNAAGEITVTPGQSLVIPKIPEGAQIQVTETLALSADYRYDSASVKYESLVDAVEPTAVNTTSGENVTKGIQFAMGSDNMEATILNSEAGKLEISHDLDPTSTGTGRTYVAVKVLDGDNKEAASFENILNGPITIGKDYVYSGTHYKVQITLTTEMDNFTKYNTTWLDYQATTPATKWTYKTDSYAPDGAEYSGPYYSNDKKTHTLTYTYNLNNLFTANNHTVPQRTDKLPFYSIIDKPELVYELTYTYPAYNRSFKTQAYTVRGEFTEDELEKYMTYSNEELAFNTSITDAKKRTFISSHAPYEDNFHTQMDYKTAAITNRGWDSSEGYFGLTIELKEEHKPLNIYFKLPYSYDYASSFNPVSDKNDGKIYYKEETTEAKASNPVYPRNWYATSGAREAIEDNISNTSFVTAPLILSDQDGNNAKYFRYWKVTTKGNYNQEEVEYTRCYDPEFNLALFQDCVIEPVYENTFAPMPNPPTSWEYDRNNSRFDPDAQRKIDGQGITITFIENSRNQYNRGQKGDLTTPSRVGGGDRMYSDFLLSFNNIAGDGIQLNQLQAGTKKAGLIIESVGTMDYKTGTQEYETSAEYYRNKYGTEISSETEAKIKSLINDNKVDHFAKSEFDVTELDNKNRIQYYYSLANKAHTTDTSVYELSDTLQNKYKYYRAYAYIYDVNNKANTIHISETPVYFTIYDMATIENGTFLQNDGTLKSGGGN